jgi:hypothetical protein
MTRTVTKPAAARSSSKKIDVTSQLTEQLKELRLPKIRDCFHESATRAATENLSHPAYLSELATMECESRREGRIKRLLTKSQLPSGKTWDSFDFTRLPLHVARHMESLRDGSVLDRRENILIFGQPGSGKSHALPRPLRSNSANMSSGTHDICCLRHRMECYNRLSPSDIHVSSSHCTRWKRVSGRSQS